MKTNREKIFDFFKKYHVLPLLLVLLIQIPLILPFFRTGFFPSHDDVQVVRVFEMFQSLKYGGFPPRWQSGLLYGHGYPLYTFYSPFVYLIGSFFSLIGANFLIATKLVFILSFLIGSWGIYLLLVSLFNTPTAILGSILFSFAPYRAVDVYVRGSLAEFFAFSLYPLILFANLKILLKKDKKYFPVLSLLLAILLLSHNISAFIMGVFLVCLNLFYVILKFDKKILKGLLISAGLSIGISSFFILPLIIEEKYVKLSNFENFPYQKFFITLEQFWNSPWGFGGFTDPKPMSLQFGKVLIILVFLTLILNQLIKTKYKSLLNFLLISFIVIFFLETKYSLFIWDKFTLLHYFQFPWRLHTLLVVLASILAAASFFLLQKLFKSKYIQLFIFLGFSLLSIKENYLFFRPQKYTNDPAVSETTTWDDEYMPIWVKQKPKEYSSDKIISLDNEAIISDIFWGYHTKSFQVKSDKLFRVKIAQIYYPGWNAYIDGEKTEIFYSNENGFMEINCDPGEYQIVFKFESTYWRRLSEIASIISVFLLIYYFYSVLKRH